MKPGAMAKAATEIVQVKVRMTRGLQLKLEREATNHGLTTNAEILRRLEEPFYTKELMELFNRLGR